MKDIDTFLAKLYKITDELDNLSDDLYDSSRQQDGTEFKDQKYLADKLEESMHVITHEMATEISFMAECIKMLADFMEFRKEFNELSDQELESIIDQPIIPLTHKLSLAKRITNGNKKMIIEKINTIKQIWNKRFINRSYREVRNRVFSKGNCG